MRWSGPVALAALLTVAAAAASAPGARADAPATERVVRDSRIVESSGLARSLRHRGILWTHNDSGHPARLYAVGPDGRTAAVLEVDTPYDSDWEAVTTVRTPDGQAFIAVADIGDNAAGRDHVQILLIPEPARLASSRVTPVRVLRLRYPGGPVDAETVLADPRDGRLFVVSKLLFGATLYAVPASQWPGRRTGTTRFTVAAVARLGADLVTDGTVLPDGRLLLRGYGDLTLLPPPPSGDGASGTDASGTDASGTDASGTDASGTGASGTGTAVPAIAVRRLPDQEQGESLTLTADGRHALVGSEGARQPVLKVPLPEPAGPPSPTSSPHQAAPPQATAPTLPGGRLLPVLGGAVLLALLGAALVITVRRQ